MRLAAALAVALAVALPRFASAQEQNQVSSIDRAMEILPSDPKEARRLLEALAEAGDAEGMNALAALVELGGPDWEADPDRANSLREAALKAGSKGAALNLALRIMMDSQGDHARAIELLRIADTEAPLSRLARYGWGRAYLFGWGVESDLGRGIACLESFVDTYEGESSFKSDAEFLIARGYQNGWGVAIDPERAYAHMRIAADLEDRRAQWYAGMMLLDGFGVEPDEMEAYSFVKLSAEAGYEEGMISHAVMLALGQGIDEDDAAARVWYRKAAELGSAHAMRGLGMMLATGEGGPTDSVGGFALLELAAEAGESMAAKLLRSLSEQGAPDAAAIDAAKKDWLSKFGAPEPVQ